jgi:hypothetical protein
VAVEADATGELLAALERALAGEGALAPDHPQRVLIVGELGQLDSDQRVRLERLLTSNGARGLRVLAASTDLGIAGDLAASFDSRAVYALDEEDGVRVLGSADASGLPSDGSMLVRLAGRPERGLSASCAG